MDASFLRVPTPMGDDARCHIHSAILCGLETGATGGRPARRARMVETMCSRLAYFGLVLRLDVAHNARAPRLKVSQRLKIRLARRLSFELTAHGHQALQRVDGNGVPSCIAWAIMASGSDWIVAGRFANAQAFPHPLCDGGLGALSAQSAISGRVHGAGTTCSQQRRARSRTPGMKFALQPHHGTRSNVLPSVLSRASQ